MIIKSKTRGGLFGFNREISEARLRRMRVMLPVTDDGEPDFHFMSSYVKNAVWQSRELYARAVA